MSINACTLNAYTINTLCGARRQAIIDSLLPKPPVIADKSHVQHVRADVRLPMSAFKRQEDEHTVVTQTELSHVQVSVQFNGKTYSQTMKRDDNIPLVTVYNVKKTDGENEPIINISDLKITGK